MTLFSLAQKNIKGNIKNYLLYFMSMVISIVIFYTFNSFMYIPKITATVQHMDSSMSQTSYILIGFLIVFIGYSNAFFTKKRKKEVGLYSLLGVRKKVIARMLFFENMIIGAITLQFGLALGILFSRLFLMLLLQLLGLPIEVGFSIPMEAILTTAIVFIGIMLFTSVQSYLLIYRFKLIDLFQAEKKGEQVPKASLIAAIVAVVLLGGSYWLMFNAMAMLAMPIAVVGTYVLFRSLTVYLLKRAQHNKARYYNGINIIGTSNLLYRIKGNALMLTVIALLITAALPYVQAAFSEYAAVEKEARASAPFSYLHLSKGDAVDKQFERLIAADSEHPIIDQLDIPVVQVKGNSSAPFQGNQKEELGLHLISENTFDMIKQALNWEHLSIPDLTGGQAVALKQFINQPAETFSGHEVNVKVPLPQGNQMTKLELVKLEEQSLRLTSGPELLYLVVDDSMFNRIADQVSPITYKAYTVDDEQTTKETSELIMKLAGDDAQMMTFYDEYTELKAFTGMKIFVVSSLALVLLAATGSVIYFKQLTEAHADQPRYAILRKIGVSRKDVRRTIRKQTLFVFLLPLVVGMLNAGMLVLSVALQYNMDLRESITSFTYATAAYGVIYLMYYVLTIHSYNRIVNK
ncbi:FtsX-like permease family protein [Paenibacillus sp. 481]|uniref:FtsX-like permease family protein n=1 Tax=Paenibacillus sp. 481 TaxID=2835869 RepID=UPI001E566A33|nr:ABC transporter permease [Paenibacillus sp. 481]UHA71870.1 ABC transporter permease [Paenibacillus sp. 481]